MKIHKNKLKKYIKDVLKEAYLRDKNGRRLSDPQGNDILPTGLQPAHILDLIEKEYLDPEDGSGTYNDYRQKYLRIDYDARMKNPDAGIDIRSKELLSIPVAQAGLNVLDNYLGPGLANIGYDYVIEKDDFKDKEIDGVSVEKEILSRYHGRHNLIPKEPGVEGAPYRIEVFGHESLSAPSYLESIYQKDVTEPRVPLRNTVSLEDDKTEEAPGVYPRTEDVPEDYESNMTMDIDPRELGSISALERSKIASDRSGLNFGEYLPTGIDTGYDHFFQEPIPGEEDYMEKNYPGSKQQKYMKSYKK